MAEKVDKPPPQADAEVIFVPPDLVQLSDDPLIEMLTHVWSAICETYDVVGTRPGMPRLFEGAQLIRPYDAAETVIVNMLLEVVERVDRFSPWYAQPAKTYGIVAERDHPVRWRLTAQGCQRWWSFVDALATVIEENTNLIKAMILVENLMLASEEDEPCVSASCRCFPPRTIQVKRSIFNKTEIFCESCGRPFQIV
ncbi:MAG: hypothetical protein H6666_09985 [Ardenticatenaceae bacterium]|nr:hypothetical protein [Anaerolineales bacterium]MCB8918246.1 hypothetical protein [Ardenticatenaceae bacterium]